MKFSRKINVIRWTQQINVKKYLTYLTLFKF